MNIGQQDRADQALICNLRIGHQALILHLQIGQPGGGTISMVSRRSNGDVLTGRHLGEGLQLWRETSQGAGVSSLIRWQIAQDDFHERMAALLHSG